MNSRQSYIHQVLLWYRCTPQTTLHYSRASRSLAAQLFDRGIPLSVVADALTLVTARRLSHQSDAPPLPPIRTLHYILPVVEEILQNPPDPMYFRYLRSRLHLFL